VHGRGIDIRRRGHGAACPATTPRPPQGAATVNGCAEWDHVVAHCPSGHKTHDIGMGPGAGRGRRRLGPASRCVQVCVPCVLCATHASALAGRARVGAGRVRPWRHQPLCSNSRPRCRHGAGPAPGAASQRAVLLHRHTGVDGPQQPGRVTRGGLCHLRRHRDTCGDPRRWCVCNVCGTARPSSSFPQPLDSARCTPMPSSLPQLWPLGCTTSQTRTPWASVGTCSRTWPATRRTWPWSAP
jgi:hypothetical protein